MSVPYERAESGGATDGFRVIIIVSRYTRVVRQVTKQLSEQRILSHALSKINVITYWEYWSEIVITAR